MKRNGMVRGKTANELKVPTLAAKAEEGLPSSDFGLRTSDFSRKLEDPPRLSYHSNALVLMSHGRAG